MSEHFVSRGFSGRPRAADGGRLPPGQYIFSVAYSLTREQPAGWRGFTRRVDREMLAAVGWSAAERPRIFICGPTAVVESVASACVALGHASERIKTERFWATGA